MPGLGSSGVGETTALHVLGVEVFARGEDDGEGGGVEGFVAEDLLVPGASGFEVGDGIGHAPERREPVTTIAE